MKNSLLKKIPSALVAISFSLCASSSALADTWKTLQSGTSAELRGLSVVSKNVAWASGAKGTVLKMVDGETWQNVSIAEAASLDFRDVQGIDSMTAIAMSAGPSKASTIYKTVDGGAHWELMIVNEEATGFWDAIDFWDANNGVVFGDPVNGQFQILVTSDGGKTWKTAVKDGAQLAALANEGAFAASGTCVHIHGKKDVWFVTGGAEKTRVFHSPDRGLSWMHAETPIPAAAPPKGLFSVAFADLNNGYAVGGDYQKPKGETLNAAVTHDGGKTWTAAPALPSGFLSVVTTIPGNKSVFLVGGLAGSGVSSDGGKTWEVLGETPLNAMAFADGSHGWAVGPKGLLLQYVGKSLAK